MAYVAIGLLVVAVLAIGFAVIRNLGHKAGAPFGGTDHTPLGDTAEHAGEHSADGETVHEPEFSVRR